MEWTLSVKSIYRNRDTRGCIDVFSQNLSEYGKCCTDYKVKREKNSSEVLKSEHGISWDGVQMQLLDGGEDNHLISITYYDGSTDFFLIESRVMTKYTCQGNSYFFYRKNSTLSRRPSICYRNPHIELLYWGRFEFLLPGSIYVKSPPVLAPIYNFPHILAGSQKLYLCYGW